MTDNATKMIDIRYFSRCLNETAEAEERRDCGGLRVGNTVEFDVVIKVFYVKQCRAKGVLNVSSFYFEDIFYFTNRC